MALQTTVASSREAPSRGIRQPRTVRTRVPLSSSCGALFHWQKSGGERGRCVSGYRGLPRSTSRPPLPPAPSTPCRPGKQCTKPSFSCYARPEPGSRARTLWMITFRAAQTPRRPRRAAATRHRLRVLGEQRRQLAVPPALAPLRQLRGRHAVPVARAGRAAPALAPGGYPEGRPSVKGVASVVQPCPPTATQRRTAGHSSPLVQVPPPPTATGAWPGPPARTAARTSGGWFVRAAAGEKA